MTAEHQFELTGGRLCLDFVNTLDNRPAPNRHDYFAGYPDLVHWARQARILSAPEAKILQRQAGRHAKQAAAVLARAKALREALFRVFSAVAFQRRAPAEDLRLLDQSAAAALAASRLTPSRSGFVLENAAPPKQLDRMLVPVARSAQELLLSSDLHLLRECAAENCAWLFVDTTKNHRRRWCDVRTCGNRAKVRRFRERLKQK